MAKAASEILGVEHHWLGIHRLRVCRRATRCPPCRRAASPWCRWPSPPSDWSASIREFKPHVLDDLRRERRVSAPRPHPLPPGVDGRVRGRSRLPPVPRRGRSRGACRSCTTTTGSCRKRMQFFQDEFAKHRQGRPVREVAQGLGSRARRHRRRGSRPASSARSTSPGATTPSARTPPRSTRRASSSPRRWSGSSGCGPPRSTSWRARASR